MTKPIAGLRKPAENHDGKEVSPLHLHSDLGVVVTETAVQFLNADTVTIAQWHEAGAAFARAHSKATWAFGDWWNVAENRKFGEGTSATRFIGG